MQDPAYRPERALLHPLWLASLTLLIVNDRLFKGSGLVHQLVTGKLSDVVGLIVAPALLAALLRLNARRSIALAHVAVGVGFTAIQLSVPAARGLEATMAWLGVAWRIWPDATDLLALPALWLSWRGLLGAMAKPLSVPERGRQAGQLLAASVGLMACVGTSAVPPEQGHLPPQPSQVVAASQPSAAAAAEPLTVASLNGTWRALRLASSEHAWHHTYRFDNGQYRVSGYPSWEESGRIQVLTAEPRRLRVRFTDRVFDGKQDEPRDSWIELVASGDSAQLRIDGDRYQRNPDATVAGDEAVPTLATPAGAD